MDVPAVSDATAQTRSLKRTRVRLGTWGFQTTSWSLSIFGDSSVFAGEALESGA